MKCNVGKTDKIIRIILGIVIILIAIFYQSWWGIIGAILLVTGLFGWCPAYKTAGINSCGSKEE